MSLFNQYEAWVCNHFMAAYPDNKFTFKEVIQHIRDGAEDDLDIDENNDYARYEPFDCMPKNDYADIIEQMHDSLICEFVHRSEIL